MIVHLKGGLCNQAFQFAFGISVAKERGEPLSFTRYAVDSDTKRCYGLGVFDLPITFSEKLEEPVYQENPFSFNPQVYTVQAKSFDGQWQSERYFNVPLVQAAFFRRYDKMSDQSRRVADEITKQPSAFIHVRRSDYIAGNNAEWHTNLPLSYYEAGIEKIRAAKEGIRFFVFSDDTTWCKQTWPDFTVVDHNKPGGKWFGKNEPGDEHQDIWLASMCEHGIIANSSFSWWMSWLGGRREGRIVVAPKNWFGPQLAYLDTSDIIPARWIKL